jgi:hypothetical protein
LSTFLTSLDNEREESKVAGQRMAYASETMIQAGKNLQGVKPEVTGKSWLKGGGM